MRIPSFSRKAADMVGYERVRNTTVPSFYLDVHMAKALLLTIASSRMNPERKPALDEILKVRHGFIGAKERVHRS